MSPACMIVTNQAYRANRHPWTSRFDARGRRYSWDDDRAWSYSFGPFDGREGIGWST